MYYSYQRIFKLTILIFIVYFFPLAKNVPEMVPSMHPRIRDVLSVCLRKVGVMGSVPGSILGMFWGAVLVPKCVPKRVPKRDPKVGAEWEDVVCPTGPAGGGGGCGVSSRRQLEEYSEPSLR